MFVDCVVTPFWLMSLFVVGKERKEEEKEEEKRKGEGESQRF